MSNTVAKVVSPGRDALFLRYYAKYDAGFDVIGSSHNGSTMSAQDRCPGVRADGFNKFLVSYEAWRDSSATPNPGRLNAYVYHPDQRDIWGDHFFPTGNGSTVLEHAFQLRTGVRGPARCHPSSRAGTATR